MEISGPIRYVDPAAVEILKESVNPVYHPRLELAKVLMGGNLEVVCALEKAVQSTDYDTISGALVTVFRQYGGAERLLQKMIALEIGRTHEVATLFRGVSLTTKVVSAFCMQEGQPYCKNILDPCLRMFCIDEVSIEVDPSKLRPDEDLSNNQHMLLGVCKGLLNHITRSVDQCSYPLRKMFSQTKKMVKMKFPEHHLRVVGGFYFLRFLCPALVCPEGFRLISAPPGAKSRRSLILVSKILQNLANDVEFGEKESYMLPVNTFIKSNQTTMWDFLDQLSNPTKANQRSFIEMKQDPLAAVHQCIQSHREKIGAILIKDGNGKLFDTLCEALENYSSGIIKIRRMSAILPPLSPPATRRRSSSAAPAVSSSSSSSPSPITASTASSSSMSLLPSHTPSPPSQASTPLSPTSTRVSELIPIATSPSHSLANLLEFNFHSPALPPSSEDLAAKLQKLNGEKATVPSEPLVGKRDLSDGAPQPSKKMEIKEVEEEMKREMQEIQALKVALESGAMAVKERAETHSRFVSLLQHLKVLLANYKRLQRECPINNIESNGHCNNEDLQQELEMSGLSL